MLVSYFFSHFKMYVVVLYSFFEITHTVISISKIAIRVPLPMLVSWIIEVYDSLEITWTCTTMVIATCNMIFFLHGLISHFSERLKS